MRKYYKALNYTGNNTEYKTGHKAFFLTASDLLPLTSDVKLSH